MGQSHIERKAEREKRRTENRITDVLEKNAPAALKARWVNDFETDASTAFKVLLTGSSHECRLCGCHQPNFQAVRLYCELAGAVGAENKLIINLHNSLGVRDETELLALVDQGRRMEGMKADAAADPETLLESALEVARMVLAQKPELRARALARLGGGVEQAEVIDDGSDVVHPVIRDDPNPPGVAHVRKNGGP